MAKSAEIKIAIDNPVNSCFVIMPFSSMYETEYQRVIQPVIEEFGVTCVRGDEIYEKQRIMDDIWNSIKNCRFAVAELTGKNPNVMYEIGLAHALGKPVVILTRNEADVPFDLKHLRYLFYDTNDPFWGDNLKLGLKSLISKILDAPDISSYLDGIDVPKAIKFETIEDPKKPTVKKPINADDVAGTWEGTFQVPSMAPHHVVMHLFSDGNEISGNATVSFKLNRLTVVQQTVKGSFSKGKLLIEGVNYTYIEQGQSTSYELDVFELTVDDGRLIGEAMIEPGGPTRSEISFKRVED